MVCETPKSPCKKPSSRDWSLPSRVARKLILLNDDEWTREDYHQRPYKINMFDDGNIEMQKYPNSWIVYGRWLEKVAVYNSTDMGIFIPSISAWKLDLLPTND